MICVSKFKASDNSWNSSLAVWNREGIINIPCETLQALAVHIAELTEDLEKLHSEKALLLQKFEYAEDAGEEAFHKDIVTMEPVWKSWRCKIES